MKINFKLFFILVGLTVIFSSCRTSAPRLDYQALARASVLLGIDINLEDDHKLYLEAADWIGAPYRGGGDSKRGTDCSGMVYQIYRKVYRIQVPRNTEELKNKSNRLYRISGTPNAPKFTNICIALLVWRLVTFSFSGTVCLFPAE
jgi:murein DD-endopeptidase / murein LD-carboxypeptidase